MAAFRGSGRDARLASIRACNRHDFLHAFALRTRPAPGATRSRRNLRASSGSVRTNSSRISRPERASADTVRNVRGKKLVVEEDDEDRPIESDGEDDVPPYLNESRLDALDMINDLPELRALVRWIKILRKEHGCTWAESDVDLTNGVALLETLCIIQPELFDRASEAEGVNDLEEALQGLSVQERKKRIDAEEDNSFDPASPPPSRPTSTVVVAVPLLPRKASSPGSYSVEKECGVKKNLDEEGRAAEYNLTLLIDKMDKFVFHDWEDGGLFLGPASFGKVEAWQLAGYILLIALNGERRETNYAQLLEWDSETRDMLIGVYRSALDSFGMKLPPSHLDHSFDDEIERDEQEFEDGEYAEYAQGEVVGEEYLQGDDDEVLEQEALTKLEPGDERKHEGHAQVNAQVTPESESCGVEEIAEEDFESDSNDAEREVLAISPLGNVVEKPAAGGGAKRYRAPEKAFRKRKPSTESHTQTPPLPVSGIIRQTQTIPPKPVILFRAGTQTDPVLEKGSPSRYSKEIEILTKCAKRNEELVRSERAVRKGLEEKVSLLEEEKKISRQHIERQDVLAAKISQQLQEHRSENKKLRDEINKLKAEVVASMERERVATRMLNKAKEGLVEAQAENDSKRTLPSLSQRLAGLPVKETRATRAAAVQRHKAEAASLRRKLADAERKLAMKEKNEDRLYREVERNAKKGNSFGRFFKRTDPVK